MDWPTDGRTDRPATPSLFPINGRLLCAASASVPVAVYLSISLSLSDSDSEIKTRLGALFHLLQGAPIYDVHKIRRDFRPPPISLCLHFQYCLSPKCGTFLSPLPLSVDVLYGSPLTLLTESYDCLSAE